MCREVSGRLVPRPFQTKIYYDPGYYQIQAGWSIRMWAVTAEGSAPASNWFTVGQTLKAPDLESATLVSDPASIFGADLSLSFTPPPPTPGLAILYYICEVSPDGGNTVYVCDGGANGIQGSFGTTSPQIVPDSIYYDPGYYQIQAGWSVRIWAVSSSDVGDESAWVQIS